MPDLFDPLQLGDLLLPNRIIMAPLTRCRAEPGRIPGELMVEYYRQRASAGLIISEATAVTPMGVGYPDTPGIWSDDQVRGWQKVTSAVHETGGRIILQLWHVGRISDPLYLSGVTPVAPSALQPAGTVSLVRPRKAYVTPRALDIEEIPGLIQAYRQGAENARTAGFDGVEIHAANGYLLDQFLQSGANQRTDAYGGSIENRVRLLLEITDAILETWMPGRVGVHLSPRGDSHDMGDAQPRETFGTVTEALGRRGIAFLCLREHDGPDSLAPMMREAFPGQFIINEGLDQDQASRKLAQGHADAAAFGRLFIANPDLPARFMQRAALNTPRRELFYASGPEGYTDYSALDQCQAPA
ncbi:MAG: alkene reductase [Castellaniella sp.]|uniref:alkene reductase n=1 Tax=Castellaniella sp. TaxID=1955812 RepID=UPI003A8C8475